MTVYCKLLKLRGYEPDLSNITPGFSLTVTFFATSSPRNLLSSVMTLERLLLLPWEFYYSIIEPYLVAWCFLMGILLSGEGFLLLLSLTYCSLNSFSSLEQMLLANSCTWSKAIVYLREPAGIDEQKSFDSNLIWSSSLFVLLRILKLSSFS